jgi:hypothetical protein
MRIDIGTTNLALGTGRNQPSYVNGLDGQRLLEVEPLTRSAEPGIFTRGNVSHTLTVTVSRHHATPAAAADFVLSHMVAVWGLTGTLYIESHSGNRWTLSQAQIESARLKSWIGASTMHDYVVKGGLLTALIAPVVTTSSPLTAGTVGAAYSVSLAATGSTTYTWTVESGTLPDGLTLTTAGVLAGTPTAAISATPLVIRCTAADTAYALKSFTLTIAA